jgi:hypothetical protein
MAKLAIWPPEPAMAQVNRGADEPAVNARPPGYHPDTDRSPPGPWIAIEKGMEPGDPSTTKWWMSSASALARR